jgi:membrane associated rhomboid family serine protease
MATLHKSGVERQFINELWVKAANTPERTGRRCPHCTRPMYELTVDVIAGEMAIDLCRECALVWFDPAEQGRVPCVPAPVNESPYHGAREERMALGRAIAEAVKDEQERKMSVLPPVENWKLVPAILGYPVECDVPRVTILPTMTYLAVFGCITVFALSWGRHAAVAAEWGVRPDLWYRTGGATLAASFFLHAGLFHLIGNMYFLWIFGDNVEDHLGHLRFVALVMTAHVAGVLVHGMIDPRSSMPLVGASGGISGVIAYYAVAFPRARLGLFFGYPYPFFWLRLPAWGAFAIWVILQLVGAWKQVAGYTTVSSLAHLGGTLVGLWLALSVRRKQARPSPGTRIESPAKE